MEYKPSFADQLNTDYICHHGIKGQKWGVRRFQNEDGSLTAAGQSRYGSRNGNKKGGIKSKNVAKAVGVAAAVGLAGAGAYAVAKNMNATDPFVGKPGYDPETGLIKQQTPDGDVVDSAMKVNPNADTNKPEYLTNCTYCSAALDLRRRGFNVEAGAGQFRTENFIKNFYKDAEKHVVPAMDIGDGVSAPKSRELTFKNVRDNMKVLKHVQQKAINDPDGYRKDQRTMTDSILKKCESMGPGARGAINVTLNNGMGHCIAFECDDKGSPHIIDSQIIGRSDSWLYAGAHGDKKSAYVDQWLANSIMPYMPVSVTRYDNAEPNYEFLKKKKIVVPGK